MRSPMPSCLLATCLILFLGSAAWATEPPSPTQPPPTGKLPKLPGKAPVFGIVTRVDTATETFNFFLLFDEIVNTEKVVEDDKGVVKKRTADRVMTSRDEEKMGRPLKGCVISTGEGKVIPRKLAMAELPGKLVIFCDDFDGLHPTYRKMLAKDTWIIEIEKPKGLRVESPLERLEALKAEKGVAAKLFLEVKAADTKGILAALETDPEQAGKKYREFAIDLNQRVKWLNHTDRKQIPPAIGEFALLMLAGLDPRLPKASNPDLFTAYHAIHQSYKPLQGEPKPRAELLSELLKAWMKARLGGTREYAWMAKQYGLLDLSKDLIAVVLDSTMNAEVRYNHLWPLADLAEEAELKMLAPLLDKADLVDRGPGVIPSSEPVKQSPQQWRDVVLGVLVRTTDQKMADYGFQYPNNGLMPTNPGIDFVFPDDETRQKALAKWKARTK